MDITGESVLVRKKIHRGLRGRRQLLRRQGERRLHRRPEQGERHQGRTQAKERARSNTSTTRPPYYLSYMNSVERDYISNTTHFSLSQDMFGDLTTLTSGLRAPATRWARTTAPPKNPMVAWLGHADTRSYDAGLSQIFTKNLIAGLNFEVITDEGYLANPYRSIRYYDTTNAKGYSLASQVYPDTRTSTAVQGRRSTTCPIGPRSPVRIGISTTPGASSATPTNSTTPIPSATSGYSRDGSATTNRDMRRSTAICSLTPTPRISRARDQDLAASEIHHGRQSHLRLPARRLENFQARYGYLDISRIHFNYLDFRDIKDYGVPQYQPGTEPLYNSTPPSIKSICRCSLTRTLPLAPTLLEASGRRRRWRWYRRPNPRSPDPAARWEALNELDECAEPRQERRDDQRLRCGKAATPEARQAHKTLKKCSALSQGTSCRACLRGYHGAIERKNERRKKDDLRQTDQPGNSEHGISKAIQHSKSGQRRRLRPAPFLRNRP